MSRTVYREGAVSIGLTGDLEAWARSVFSDATRAAVEVAERELQPVADAAEAAWYGPQGVRRVTGQAGKMEVVTTIDVGRGVVRVSVGSSDPRTGERGKPIPVLQHRPGRLSLVLKEVSHKEYWDTPKNRRGPYPQVYVRNPLAGDGGNLLQDLVIKPGRLAVSQRIAPAVALRLKTAVERGGAG